MLIVHECCTLIASSTGISHTDNDSTQWIVITVHNDIDTVNIDIFLCINILGFMKMGNSACIKICILCIIGSLGYCKSKF